MVVLYRGSHDTREDGMCVMEFVSFLAGEPHSASPKCVSTVLTGMMIDLNDSLDAVTRQMLKPYACRIIGTKDDGHDYQRRAIYERWIEELREKHTVGGQLLFQYPLLRYLSRQQIREFLEEMIDPPEVDLEETKEERRELALV